MVAPGVVHSFVYERDSAGQQVTVPTQSLRTWLATTPTLDAQLNRSIHVARDDTRSDICECEELFALLTREFSLGRPGRAAALNAHALVLALWFLRHDAHGLSGLRQRALRDTLVQRYRVMLEQNFQHQRPVQFYAQALGITADHLSRACRASTGQGALQLMHDRVALEARRLLAYTASSITDIARDLGFDDPGHFSRFFAKAVGKAPSIYRSAVASGLASAPGLAK